MGSGEVPRSCCLEMTWQLSLVGTDAFDGLWAVRHNPFGIGHLEPRRGSAPQPKVAAPAATLGKAVPPHLPTPTGLWP
jgi:hypothetical protein